MQETIVCLCHHRSAVYARSCHVQCCPYRIPGEQLVVRWDSGKLDHTQFHGKVIDQFLYFFFCDDALIQISLEINIKEGRDTSYRHGCTILGLDGCQITKVKPLDRLFCILCRSGNVIAVNGCHLFHAFQCTDLLRDLLAQTDDFALHAATAAFCLVFLFLLDQKVDTVKRHSTIIADDTSASISIRQTGHDLIVAGL